MKKYFIISAFFLLIGKCVIAQKLEKVPKALPKIQDVKVRNLLKNQTFYYAYREELIPDSSNFCTFKKVEHLFLSNLTSDRSSDVKNNRVYTSLVDKDYLYDGEFAPKNVFFFEKLPPSEAKLEINKGKKYKVWKVNADLIEYPNLNTQRDTVYFISKVKSIEPYN